MTALVSYDDALELLLRDIHPLTSEIVTLEQGVDRILATDIVAPRAQPPVAMSAMDGYAVRRTDLGNGPWRLTVIAEVPAGGHFDSVLGAGEAVRLFTGAPVPTGADLVIIQENVEREGDVIRGSGGADGSAHIRLAGVDFNKGATLLSRGRRLSAVDLALVAAANEPTLTVQSKPRVAIFASGDELVEPGASLTPDTIVNLGSYGVAGLVTAWGGTPVLEPILPDDQQTVEKRLSDRLADCDVLVTIGGASVGDYDVIKPAARALGADLQFEKVAVKPGKPCWHARTRDGALFIGLPGNPASALVCAHLFLRPLVARLIGQIDEALSWQEAIVGENIPPNGPRESFLRGRSAWTPNGLRVVADRRQDSSLLTPFAAANILIRRPPYAAEAVQGDVSSVLPLESHVGGPRTPSV